MNPKSVATFLICFCCGLAVVVAGCSSKKVSRIDPDKTVDLSGYWNDTDSRLVAEEMIGDCLSHVWLTNYIRAEAKNPTVIAGSIRNKSLEHIAVGTFLMDIERAMVNSGSVQVVASAEERERFARNARTSASMRRLRPSREWDRRSARISCSSARSTRSTTRRVARR